MNMWSKKKLPKIKKEEISSWMDQCTGLLFCHIVNQSFLRKKINLTINRLVALCPASTTRSTLVSSTRCSTLNRICLCNAICHFFAPATESNRKKSVLFKLNALLKWFISINWQIFYFFGYCSLSLPKFLIVKSA